MNAVTAPEAAAADISVRYHCNHCLKHFPTEVGARQHVEAVHGSAS